MSWLKEYEQLPKSFTLTEQHDPVKLAAALKHPLLSGDNHKGIRTSIAKLIDRLDSNGCIDVTYTRGDYGRYFASGPCSTSLKKSVRADSLPDNYVDVDVQNCFPCAMLDFCVKHKIDKKQYNHLKKFVENRDSVYTSLKITAATLAKHNEKRRLDGEITDHTERDLAKKIMHMTSYGAGVKGYYTDLGISDPFAKPSLASKVADQIKFIAKGFCGLPCYKPIVDFTVNKKKLSGENYHVGCSFSTMLQSFEALYVHKLRMIMELKRPGCVKVYEYDGLIFDKNILSIDEFDEIINGLDDWPLSFAIKERCTKLSEITMSSDDSIEPPADYLASAAGTTLDLVHLIFDARQTPLSTPIANILVYMYNGKIRTTGKNAWFKFDAHRWSKLEIGPINDIDTLILPLLHKLDGVGMRGLYDLIFSLNSIRDKEKVIDDLFNKLHVTDLESKLDANPNLIGFNNGVYDLANNVFRDGQPNDYITMSTGYDYVDTPLVPDDPLDTFLKQVFPIPEYREYFLRTSASFLEGRNRAQSFDVWPGTGGNGKSKTMELVSAALGQYCMSISSEIMTGKGIVSGEAASPQLALTLKKRLVYFSEIRTGSRLNEQLVKQLTGGDEITVRSLYGNPVTRKPGFNLVGLFNSMPGFDANDGGMVRRIRPIPFVSRFVKPTEPTDPGRFIFSRNVSLTVDSLKMGFMSLLLREYKAWVDDNFADPTIPDGIARYTGALLSDNAPATVTFVNECIQSDPVSFLTLSDAYAAFLSYNTGPKVQRGAFKSFLNTALAPESKNRKNLIGWLGWKLVMGDSESDSGDYGGCKTGGLGKGCRV